MILRRLGTPMVVALILASACSTTAAVTTEREAATPTPSAATDAVFDPTPTALPTSPFVSTPEPVATRTATAVPIPQPEGPCDAGPLALANPDRPIYRGSLVVDPATHRVEGFVSVVFMPDLDVEALYVRLWPNGPRTSQGGVVMELTNVSFESGPVPFDIVEPTIVRINIPGGLDAGTSIEVADIEWDATRKAMQRCDQDAMYVRIPAAENDRWLLLTTAAIGKGRSVEAREATSAAEQALTGVSHRASVDRRAVSTSRNFVNHHQVRATTADPKVVWGQLTRIDTSNMHESLSKLAERTGVDFVCVTRDEDDDLAETTRWRLRGDPMSMRLALAAGGHRTDAELAEDREAKKYADEFEDFMREQRRRPIHNPSIGRPREMAAAN